VFRTFQLAPPRGSSTCIVAESRVHQTGGFYCYHVVLFRTSSKTLLRSGFGSRVSSDMVMKPATPCEDLHYHQCSDWYMSDSITTTCFATLPRCHQHVSRWKPYQCLSRTDHGYVLVASEQHERDRSGCPAHAHRTRRNHHRHT